MTWRALHNTTSLLVVIALLTAIPLTLNLPRGLREPWALAHIAASIPLLITGPLQLFVGFKHLWRLRQRDGLSWLNGWFGRLLFPLVGLTTLSGVLLWRMTAPGGPAWPALLHRLTWLLLLPTLGGHLLLSAWLRRRR